jgi:putative ATP-binding cassette transporter
MDFLLMKGLRRLFNIKSSEQKRYNRITERFETPDEIEACLRDAAKEDIAKYYSLDIKEDLKNGTMLKPAADRPIRTAWKLAMPYWFDYGEYTAAQKDKDYTNGVTNFARSLNWPALGLLGTVVGGTAFQIYMGIQLNFWGRDFGNALQTYDKESFWDLLVGDFSNGVTPDAMFGSFCALATIYIATAVWTNYLEARLDMNWRTWMTDELTNKWVNKDKKSYYRLQNIYARTENPDQRVSDDVGKFTSGFMGLTVGFGRNIANLISYSSILWGLSAAVPVALAGVTIPGFMMWAVIGYAAVGTLLTHKIGKPLVAIDYQRERKEADFRASLIRVKENAESIALSNGEAAERGVLKKKFTAVVENYWALIKRNKKLQWLTNYYEQAAAVFPYIVAAPSYFADSNIQKVYQCRDFATGFPIHERPSQEAACNVQNDVFTFGNLNQLASAFGRVQDSLSWFIQAYPVLAAFKATTDRLGGFVEDIETSEAEVELIREGKAEGFRTHLQGEDAAAKEDVKNSKPKGPKPKI